MAGESDTPTAANTPTRPNAEPEPLPLWLSEADALTVPSSITTTATAGTSAPAASSSTPPPIGHHRPIRRDILDMAAAIPTPVDERFGPCRAYVGTHGGCWSVHFALDGGRERLHVGPLFTIDKRGQRLALELCRALNQRLARGD